MAIKTTAELLQDISNYITNKVGKIRRSEHGAVERDIVESLDSLITAEKNARINADSLLAANMDELDQLLQDEELARYNADEELQNQINNKQDALGFTPENTVNKGQNSGYCELDSGAKVPLARLPSTLLVYKGVWNATTNTPALVNPDETKKGWVYTVGVAGSQFGIDWKLGDWLIYNDSGVVEKSDNSDDVTSVNGKQGAVVLTTDDISDLDKVNKWTSAAEKITWNAKMNGYTRTSSDKVMTSGADGKTLKETPVTIDSVGNVTTPGSYKLGTNAEIKYNTTNQTIEFLFY